MKQRCIQCGKKFEHAPEFVKVYTDKKLEPPKRCLECLRKNRAQMGKVSGAKDYKHSTVQLEEIVEKPVAKINTRFLIAVIVAALVVILLASYGGVKIVDSYVENYEDTFEIPSGNGGNNQIAAISDNEKDTSDNEQSTDPQVIDNRTNGQEDGLTETSQEHDETGTDETAEEIVKEKSKQDSLKDVMVEKPTVTETESETEEAVQAKAFRFKTKTLKDEHYNKHGIEMGFSSADEYEKAASAVVNNPAALHKTEAEDGDDVYYIVDTNEFVIVSKRGFIRTYFKPDAGKAYYDRQ